MSGDNISTKKNNEEMSGNNDTKKANEENEYIYFKAAWITRLGIITGIIVIVLVSISSVVFGFELKDLISLLSFIIAILAFIISYYRLEIILGKRDVIGRKIGGVKSKTPEALLKFYDESPITFNYNSRTIKIPQKQSIFFKFGMPLQNIFLKRNKKKVFKLNQKLLSLSIRIQRDFEKRKEIVFNPYDKVGILTRIFKSQKYMQLCFNKGNMLDEYTTVQNPDDDYRFCTEKHTPNKICQNSVRAFVSPQKKFPSLTKAKAAYRIGAHVILQLIDCSILLQERPEIKVATSPGEITSTVGCAIDWKDIKKTFQHFILREIKEELLIKSNKIRDLRLIAITRDFQRLGLPVFILLGRVDLTFLEIINKWNETRMNSQNPWKYPFWYLKMRLYGNRGREHWEALNLHVYRTENIPDLINNPEVQPSTKSCLYYLWLEQTKWNPKEIFNKSYFQGKHSNFIEGYETNKNLIRKFIKKIIKKYNPRRVLDVGCAMGHYIAELRKNNIEAFGIDVSEYAINNSLEPIKQFISQIDLISEDLPFSDEFFDLVICLETLEHIPLSKLENVINRIQKVLTKTGIMIISTPNPELSERWRNDLTHINIHDWKTWKSILRKYGPVEKVTPYFDGFLKGKLTSILPNKILKLLIRISGAKFIPESIKLKPYRIWMSLHNCSN